MSFQFQRKHKFIYLFVHTFQLTLKQILATKMCILNKPDLCSCRNDQFISLVRLEYFFCEKMAGSFITQ